MFIGFHSVKSALPLASLKRKNNFSPCLLMVIKYLDKLHCMLSKNFPGKLHSEKLIITKQESMLNALKAGRGKNKRMPHCVQTDTGYCHARKTHCYDQ